MRTMTFTTRTGEKLEMSIEEAVRTVIDAYNETPASKTQHGAMSGIVVCTMLKQAIEYIEMKDDIASIMGI